MDQSEIISYELRDLPIDVIEYDENQPRKELNANAAIKSLLTSIKLHGIQQPITVC